MRDVAVLDVHELPAPDGAVGTDRPDDVLGLVDPRAQVPRRRRLHRLAEAARIAQLVKETRDRSFVERGEDGRALNHTLEIAHLGGATLDNEENYLIKKLFTGGLGLVAVENQARI